MRPARLGLIALVALMSAAVVDAGDLLSITAQSNSGLTAAFTSRGTEEVRDGSGMWLGLRLPGYSYLLPDSLGVYLPVRSFLIGIPQDAQVTCEIMDPIYSDISYYETNRILARLGEAAGGIPAEPAEITMTGYLRDYRVAGLRLAPVVYDRGSGKLRVFDSFKVRVDFGGTESPAVVPAAGGEDTPVSDQNLYSRSLLNYSQARQWRRQSPLRARQGDYFSSSLHWLKIGIDTTGMYCLTGNDLEAAGIEPGTMDSGSLRLYTGGGLPLVESLAEENPDWMRMAAIKVVDGGDGKIDRADSIVFYAPGMHDWANLYDSDIGPEDHYGSFFSDRNYYWLTWDGTFTEPPKRMQAVEAAPCEPCPDCYQPESFYERIHEERDWRYEFAIRADDGWYWRILNLDNTATFDVSAPHPDMAESVMVRMRLADDHESDECIGTYRRALLRLNGVTVKDTTWPSSDTDLWVIDIYGKGFPASSGAQTVGIYLPSDLPDSLQDDGVCTKKPSLAWFQIHYWRRFEADGRELWFVSPDTTCTAKYVISGFETGSLAAFDVTDQFDVREITGFSKSGGPEYTVTLCHPVTEGEPRRYAVVSPEVFMKPAVVTQAVIDNIRYTAGRPYCVITHEDLTEAGAVVAGFHDGEMVTVQQIYDEFAWGVPDVTAIRDFLRWRYTRGDLAYVLLLGDATWDYKGYLTGTTFTNYVPSYERRYRTGANQPYNTDDWFVYLEPTTDGVSSPDSTAYFPTVPISRLPATSPEVADFLVENTISYISNPELGTWQYRVIMVADDDRDPKGCDAIQHTRDMEEINDDAYPAVFDRVKIYLTEYPRESLGKKPAARNDLLKNLNQGALMTNFVGHGDPRRWADEEVFNNAAAEQVAAGRRQSLLIASTCNVSKFDEPTFESAAERLLLSSAGGTIASLASTHYCQAPPNKHLHENFVDLLFGSGHPYPTIPLGDAVVGGKALTVAANSYWRFNSEMYALLGDTELKLAVPELEVRFEPPARDTIQRKGVYGFSAGVYADGQPEENFQGDAGIFARESDDTTGHDSDICFSTGGVPRHYDYELPGAVIFRGRSAVDDGMLDFDFLVSSAAREGGNGNIRCFVTDGSVSGIGLLDSLVIHGESIVEDIEGPELDLEAAGVLVETGDTVLVEQVLEILLSDESGVAVKGKSESIPTVSVAIDDTERIDLTDSVYSVEGDFRQSRAWFIVPQLTAGGHRFSVTAFDNLNNSTTREYDLMVGQRGAGAGNVVYVYPNPVSDRCYLIWEYENDLYVEVEATIYTLAGRKIWIGRTAGRSSQHMIEWDGTDLAGDAVANGTYLAVVEARGMSHSGFKTKDTIAVALVR